MRSLILLVLLALVVACTPVIREGAAPGIRVQDARAPQATIRMNTVVIIDDSLQQWQGLAREKSSKIAVESSNSRRTATGTLEAWGVLRNRTDYPLQVEGRITFFDEYQAPAEPTSAWKRIVLPPNGVGAYKEFSMKTSQIAYYYIEIRGAE